MTTKVHLGFEVGTGKAVSIPLRHMVVSGQTQEAGKTTTLEALISRTEMSALAFLTKRGEKSFSSGHKVAPYFRQRGDWQFVESILEATMQQRMKFERAWIMRSSEGALTLQDVHRNVVRLKEQSRGMNADMYMMLDAYFKIVIPSIEKVKFSKRLDLTSGLNISDLSDVDSFPPELQALVMQSSLEWVHRSCTKTITIIPEAWKFIPQKRNSPVKLAAIQLMREGAGIKNYVWLDSQDIAAVDKELLRHCPVWLLGRQRESNEIKRNLENIPEGIAKPSKKDIATLKLGEFFICYDEHCIKTYVQPRWMSDDEAKAIALGERSSAIYVPQVEVQPIADVLAHTPHQYEEIEPEISEVSEEEVMTASTDEKFLQLMSLMTKALGGQNTTPQKTSNAEPRYGDASVSLDEEALYQRFKARLTKESPALLRVLGKRPEMNVEIETIQITTDVSSLHGMFALMISDGFFKDATKAYSAWKEAKRRFGYGGPSTRAYEQLAVLVKQGFLTKEGKDGFLAVPEMKINIIRK